MARSVSYRLRVSEQLQRIALANFGTLLIFLSYLTGENNPYHPLTLRKRNSNIALVQFFKDRQSSVF